MKPTTPTTTTTVDNVEVLYHDVADLKAQYPNWTDLTDAEKATRARTTEPAARASTHNVTLRQYHEVVVDALDGQDVDLGVTHLALGDDDFAPAVSNTALGNELFRTTVTDIVNRGEELLASTFLSADQANGNSYFEAALVSETGGEDLFINRLLLEDPENRLDPKTDETTATVNITISQLDESEV